MITWDVDGKVFFTMDAQSVPGVTLPVPDAMIIKINTAIAWVRSRPLEHRKQSFPNPHTPPSPSIYQWVNPGGAPAVFPNGQDYTFHYVDWVRAWARA